jgi:glucose-6-phosphate 1-dehydrogenase
MENNNKILLPTTIIIFGATGDLVRKKIIKSLLRLYSMGWLPEKFSLLGVSRRDYSDKIFREFLLDNALNGVKQDFSDSVIGKFLDKVSYFKGDFEDKELYLELQKALVKNDSPGICDNKLFYLAVPPVFYSGMLKNISKSGLAVSCSPKTGWTRVLVEKPFGNDISTARNLDNMLGKLFKEEQIFRIDHYLAKDTIQNILFFRFSNILFEPAWNKQFIKKVEIKLLEDIDIGNRGAFYDSIGALRDVGQNHMLQMLALIAMENPGSQSSESIRKKRLDVLSSLIHAHGTGDISKMTVRGQYEGYRETKDVKPDSNTETYFKIKVYLDDKKWKGVPFYLESGKALDKKNTEINIYFHNAEACLCRQEHKEHDHRNILSIRVFPHEGIFLRFWAKKPGLTNILEPRDLEFDYRYENSHYTGEYDRVLLDCMKGDQTLFTSTKEVSKAWDYITPIIKNWGHTKLHFYKKGSSGPDINTEGEV